jgi:hypothetical protein
MTMFLKLGPKRFTAPVTEIMRRQSSITPATKLLPGKNGKSNQIMMKNATK